MSQAGRQDHVERTGWHLPETLQCEINNAATAEPPGGYWFDHHKTHV